MTFNPLSECFETLILDTYSAKNEPAIRLIEDINNIIVYINLSVYYAGDKYSEVYILGEFWRIVFYWNGVSRINEHQYFIEYFEFLHLKNMGWIKSDVRHIFIVVFTLSFI